MLWQQMPIKDTVCQTQCKNTRNCSSTYALACAFAFLCKVKGPLFYGALNSFSVFSLVCMIPLYTLEWPQGLKELDALFLLLLTCSHEGHITAR